MKTAIKVVAISLVAIMMCMALVSCGGPSGEYGNDKYTLEFSGSKITISWKGLTQGMEMSGEFELGEDEDGKQTITIDITEYEADSVLLDSAYKAAEALWEGTKSYNEGNDNNGDYIEIGGAKYYKK